MEQQNSRPDMTGTGYLVVQVTTAASAIPLEGAFVTVSRVSQDSADVIFELRTGRDGKTPRVPLPAPARAESQHPGAFPPYATYSVEVSLNGYETVVYQPLPIFDGVTAIQQADLIPVPENEHTDALQRNRPKIYETPQGPL